MSAITINSLHKSYRSEFWLKKIKAIEDLSLEVESGKVTGFLGANGAGKSTTIKCLLGLLLPDSGDIRFFGDQKLSPEVKSKIGFLPERPFFYEYLQGDEFLSFYANLSGMKSGKSLNKKIEELLELVGLSHAGDKKLREYSKGMLQRIGIAQAIIHDPDLIIFDEPMSGLDPDGRFEVNQIIQRIAEQGKTVFFSSHLLHDVEKISENIIILKKGVLKYQGALGPLLEDVSSKFQLTYVESGQKNNLLLEDMESLQSEIDSLRKRDAQIIDITQAQASLEQAYVKLNQQSDGAL